MSDDPRKRSEADNTEEYMTNMHAIQSCVALGMNNPATNYGDPKHMQVGIISAMVTDHAVAELLVEKGVFTKAEYIAQLVLSTRQELERITAEAQARLGKNININFI